MWRPSIGRAPANCFNSACGVKTGENAKMKKQSWKERERAEKKEESAALSNGQRKCHTHMSIEKSRRA